MSPEQGCCSACIQVLIHTIGSHYFMLTWTRVLRCLHSGADLNIPVRPKGAGFFWSSVFENNSCIQSRGFLWSKKTHRVSASVWNCPSTPLVHLINYEPHLFLFAVCHTARHLALAVCILLDISTICPWRSLGLATVMTRIRPRWISAFCPSSKGR